MNNHRKNCKFDLWSYYFGMSSCQAISNPDRSSNRENGFLYSIVQLFHKHFREKVKVQLTLPMLQQTVLFAEKGFWIEFFAIP